MFFICPKCSWESTGEPLWQCDACQTDFDTFQTRATCPRCGKTWTETWCPSCNEPSPTARWYWGPHCPKCRWKYLGGLRWTCGKCRYRVDVFETGEECPQCGAEIPVQCPECDQVSSHGAWLQPAVDVRDEGDPPETVDAIGGAPEWECPGPEGVVPKRRLTWMCMRMAWLIQHRGLEDFQGRRLRLPTDPGFPSSDPHGRKTLDYVLSCADLDPRRVELEFLAEPKASDGFYFGVSERDPNLYTIAIGRAALDNPLWLQAMLSHEVSHHWLAVETAYERTLDMESLTDLTATYLGFGILLMRSSQPYQHQLEAGGMILEYLSAEEHGLVLALYLKIKDIDVETVLPHVRPSIARSMRRCVRFLEEFPQIFTDVRDHPDRVLAGVEWRSEPIGR